MTLPEGSLSHSGTSRWGWKVGNYESCPLQPAAAGERGKGREEDLGILVGLSITQSHRVLKRGLTGSFMQRPREYLGELRVKLPGLQILPKINTLPAALLWK